MNVIDLCRMGCCVFWVAHSVCRLLLITSQVGVVCQLEVSLMEPLWLVKLHYVVCRWESWAQVWPRWHTQNTHTYGTKSWLPVFYNAQEQATPGKMQYGAIFWTLSSRWSLHPSYFSAFYLWEWNLELSIPGQYLTGINYAWTPFNTYLISGCQCE